MPPKKAPKKSAKTAPAKHSKRKAGVDARRTFEHLGRVQAIAQLVSGEQASIGLLVSAANEAFRREHYKDSADLLRAAEHLSFASLVPANSGGMSAELLSAIHEEFDRLKQRGEERGGMRDAPKALRTLHAWMIADAADALRQAAYRRALELARGADALSQVHLLVEKELAAGEPRQLLRDLR